MNFKDQCNRFFKSLDDILHQCFRKIKVGKQITNKEIEGLLNQKSKLNIFLNKNPPQAAKSEAEIKLSHIEDQLSKLSSARNTKIVQEHVKSLGRSDGRFSQTGMWKLKNKLWPKEQDPPMAKYDVKGNLISVPSALRKLYLEHYVQRLEHRKIKDDYVQNYDKKVILWKMRFDKLKATQSADWSMKDLRSTLKSLKNNKTRDPCGLLNELFKAPVIGRDLENAILSMVNGIKLEFFIPNIVQMSNITTIFKRRASRHDLENDRGIFGLSVFRKIIDYLTYKEKYPIIDQKMSDSNIGACKNRNIKD